MNRRVAGGLAAALLALVVPARAGGAGFSLYEQGARAMGTAGAFTARVDDPSAMFFNPAGLGRIEQSAWLLAPNLIYYKSEFAGVAPTPGFGVTEETQGQVFPHGAAYYARRVSGRVVAGVGVMSPYGLQVEWRGPDTFTGRAISTFSKITPFYFAPTVAWAPSEKWRVGAGASLVLSKVELRRHLQAYNPFDDRTDDIGTVALASRRNFGAGFNLGVQWWPCDRMRWGAAYRGAVHVDYDGDAEFRQRPTGNPTFDAVVAASFPPDQRVDTAVEFPAQASFGVARQFTKAWAGELNVNWTQWSAFDRLDLSFEATPSRNVSIPEDWHDAWNVRAGVEYRAGGASPWAWRGGWYFDESPQPTEGVGPLLPDANRHGLTGGAGWTSPGGTTVDGYLLWILAARRSTGGINRDDYNGTYQSRSVVVGASVGRAF